MVKKSFIVAGPTASGKSDFAHRLALRVGGTVINADSVQIYKGIENISASPLVDDVGGVPYKLFSITDLPNHISVADYLARATEEYNNAEVPIFVGGTGYYLYAIIHGLSPIPEVSKENRNQARKIVQEAFETARKLTDYEYKDPQRTARALEILLETGRPITEWQQLPRRGAIHPTPFRVLIMPPADVLEDRIKIRIRQMFENGGLEEARKYIEHGNRAIGIEALGKFIKGEMTEEQAVNLWALRTEQYAKRQRTWFRNMFIPDIVIPRIPAEEDVDKVLAHK